MSDYPIDDVHRLLEGLDSLISNLRSLGPETIRIDDLPELFETIHELGGWRNTTYLQTQVGINGSLLNKFLKLRGTISRSEALKVADRLRSHLKSYDQAGALSDADSSREIPRRSKREPANAVGITAELWVAVRTTSDIKMKIGAISSLLDSIIQQTKGANQPPNEQILSEIERQQLISVLETALNILKSPLVEQGLLKKAKSILTKGSESAAEKGVQQGLGKLMESAAARISELIAALFG
ncbi:MAG: hypothetical protein AB7V13_06705 [Pseudorhodoplanes sp.]|uniref:hypothetical protein n=1 Tax=Pseudorhodoplanes sp. TaxID=1934341 RepID=UPI003D0E5F29